MLRWLIIFSICVLMMMNNIKAQFSDCNFRHLNASQGLVDGVVNAIGQDKYGYIWIGTMSGLNRFNGYSVQAFYNNSKDSTSLPLSVVQSIFCDSNGELWIGCYRGLVHYDYNSSRFFPVAAMKNKEVIKMIEQAPHEIFIATNVGLAVFDPVIQTIRFLGDDIKSTKSKLLSRPIHDIFLLKNRLYLATDTGLVIYNTNTKEVQRAPLSITDNNLKLVAEDGYGNIWFTSGYNYTLLYKTDTAFKNCVVYNEFGYLPNSLKGERIIQFLIDSKKELWFTTVKSGLIKYDYKTGKFISYKNNPLKPSSLSSNHATQICQGKHGFIWVGTEGNGVDYFHPDRNVFQVILPPNSIIDRLSSLWARAFIIDSQRNYWMGMADGVIKMNPNSHSGQLFQNIEGRKPMIHFNSIRSLMYDSEGNVWIGTADGVNRYHPGTGKMDFLDEKDSLPKSFYWAILEDSRKVIWFGHSKNSYYLDPVEKKIHSIAAHPYLSSLAGKGVRSMYEDSHHRLWFGMNGSGVVMYNSANNSVKHWMRSETEDTTVINNTITSITEDKDGVMWFSSFTGLTFYDPIKNKFGWYTQENGLAAIKTSALLVDEYNRLWIGSTNGLLMLDSNRKNFKNFDLQDGLLTTEFTDMPAYKTNSGDFVYPTMKGFTVFNPSKYAEDVKDVSVYLTEFKISGSKYSPAVQFEELKQIRLRYDQNFFTLNLTALNYSNPEQTWYAYKLEGFDKDWVYTKNRNVNYTNVPGSRYTFRYKATSDPANWKVPEKSLFIEVGTVFYKTIWFWGLLVAFAVFTIYKVYNNRIEQQRQIFSLQSKANTLEKEKAVVMFESLKQQLNPHFLFNSLTSLASLIRVNQKLAGEFLEGMSKIYRYILKNGDNEVVNLGEEIAFVSNYIRLQTTRFKYGLQINVNISEEYYHYKIAPVTLQNLIENAIKHNCIDEESPLVIDIYIDSDYLVARNNLQRKKNVETSNKQGLANLKSLYTYLSQLPIQIAEDGDYFTIKIPLL